MSDKCCGQFHSEPVAVLRKCWPQWFFSFLCWSGPPGSLRRQWMVYQPFRWILFRDIGHARH